MDHPAVDDSINSGAQHRVAVTVPLPDDPRWTSTTSKDSVFITRADTLPEMLQRSLVAFSVGRLDGRLMPPMVDPVTGNLFGLFFLMIFLVGLVGQDRQNWSGRVALVVYLSVPLVALYLFSMWRFPIYDERYVLFLIPAFVLVLARGLASGVWPAVLRRAAYSPNNNIYYKISVVGAPPCPGDCNCDGNGNCDHDKHDRDPTDV